MALKLQRKVTSLKLTIYSLPHCPRCMVLLNYLTNAKIQFSIKNAQDSSEYLMRQGFVTAPVIELDGKLYSFISIGQVISLLRDEG